MFTLMLYAVPQPLYHVFVCFCFLIFCIQTYIFTLCNAKNRSMRLIAVYLLFSYSFVMVWLINFISVISVHLWLFFGSKHWHAPS